MIELDDCELVPVGVEFAGYPRCPCSAYCVPDENEDANEEETSEGAPESEGGR